MSIFSKTSIYNVERREPKMVCVRGKELHWMGEIKQLSDIDDHDGVRLLLPAIFFYPPPSGMNKLDPVGTIQEGLAKALEAYYPLSGRIFEGPNRKLMVHCNNEGIVFVEAYANMKLQQLGDTILPSSPYIKDLLCNPSGEIIVGSPLLFVQVTRFVCGAFSLGILVNHTMADALGLMLFLKAMRELIMNCASAPSVTPTWQRELLSARSPPSVTFTHDEFNPHFSNASPVVHPDNTFSIKSIIFGRKEVQSLRSQLLDTQTKRPSQFDLITACLWKCRTIALDPNPNTVIRISIPMHVSRRKWIPDLPNGYYGNALVYATAVSTAGMLCRSSLQHAVHLILQAKAQMNGEYFRSFTDFLATRGRPGYVKRWNFVVSDATKVGFDKIDLGWGEPIYGGIPLATAGVSVYGSMKNSKGEDEVVVPMCLPTLAMEKFLSKVKKLTQGPISKI